jgi:hypothetical protein
MSGTYVDTKVVCITSQSAVIKSNGNFLSNVRYNLGAIIRNDTNIVHRQVQVLNAQIPYSFYIINYTNNIFKILRTGQTLQTLTVPVGNYTANSLIAVLESLVNDSQFNITISSTNGQLTFTHNTLVFTIYNNFQYSIGSVLGFSSNTTNTSTNVSGIQTLVAGFPLNLLGIKTLQIRSANLIMNNISSVQGGATTLLASVPVSCVPFGMIDYNDRGNLITIHNDFLDDLDIEIVDGESGEYINFNGQDWAITLAFHLTRKYEVVPTLFSSRQSGRLPALGNPMYQGPFAAEGARGGQEPEPPISQGVGPTGISPESEQLRDELKILSG